MLQMGSGKKILFVIALFTIAICVNRKLENGSTEEHNFDENDIQFAHNTSEFV